MATTTHAAVDLGASSGRVVLGRVGEDTLELKEVARFANGGIDLPDGLHWNLLGLYDNALQGLAEAVKRARSDDVHISSIGIDSWAVDYGLLRDSPTDDSPTGASSLLGTPFHYRDQRTERGVAAVHQKLPFQQLYGHNGLQFLPFNTLYQLATEEFLNTVDHLLLVPDLLGYWLTGQLATEATNASTTGLLNVHTQQWDTELMSTLGLPERIFAPVSTPGTTLGATRQDLDPLLGGHQIPVTLVGSHDTASAVVGTPLSTANSAYISCGTWGLVGLELEEPVVTDAAREANFTNEGGVDGTTRFLTNVMGTWLLSETLRTWKLATGQEQNLPVLLDAAAQVRADQVAVFDVQDPRFVSPGDMPARITEICAETDQPVPRQEPVMVRSIVESIAAGFATALEVASRLSTQEIDVVHMVGGGSLNALLCQSTADRSGLPVVAGPVEATAMGNLLIQARTAGTVTGDVHQLRELVNRTHQPVTYRPGFRSRTTR